MEIFALHGGRMVDSEALSQAPSNIFRKIVSEFFLNFKALKRQIKLSVAQFLIYQAHF